MPGTRFFPIKPIRSRFSRGPGNLLETTAFRREIWRRAATSLLLRQQSIILLFIILSALLPRQFGRRLSKLSEI